MSNISITPTMAVETLIRAFSEDDDYAWSWHSNLACMCMDAGATHKDANRVTASFMKSQFKVDTSKNKYYGVMFDESCE